MKTKILKDDLRKDKILNEIKNEIIELKRIHRKVPGIAFIGFEGVPLGKYNIALHVKLAEDIGFRVTKIIPLNNINEHELIESIEKLNKDDEINAIVLLQPLPDHLNPLRIINKINPDKEVEGFHPRNMMGTLMPDIKENKYQMCLPTALFELFKSNNIQVQKDQEWVLIMDDEFFVNPLVNMIARTAFIKAVPNYNSITFLNKNSSKLVEYCKRADFLVIVTKYPEYVQPEWLKPGVFIIDIYSNLVKEIPSKDDPNKLVPIIRGGVTVDSVKNIASGIIPIPGGLMTMVLALLLRNALISFKNSLKRN